jgi:MYXO-CTERM domain-containing protein
MKAVLYLALAALVLAPSAQAAELQVLLTTDHPPEHKVLVPESRRVNTPLHVALKAKEFVCATEATYKVDSIITYDKEWAGVSLNPKFSEVKIPQSRPGQSEETFKGSDITIDVFWGENRPKTNAEITYTITVEAKDVKLDSGGPCLPDPGTNTKGAQAQITFRGEDIIEVQNQTGGPNCQLAPDDPGCLEPSETIAPKGQSPGAAGFLMLAAIGAAVALRRRRA